MSRIIFHLDLDCFFAAVEKRDNPELIDKPVIIGADPKNGQGRGVISTCSYEARKFGLHSAMPISKAYELCPHGIYLRPTFEKYSKVSKDVMTIIKSYSDQFQQGGIDECYLEVSDICSDFKEARGLADKIRLEVFEKIGITISIGVAPTKSIAKIASDHKKPNGTTVVPPEGITAFLKPLDITRIPGIGKKSKVFYYKRGIKTIGDIIATSKEKMINVFGKNGSWVWNIANGIDDREVREFHHTRKSISKERTFREDTNDFQLILSKFNEINDRIHEKLEKSNIFYRTISLKIRFKGFVTYTRAKSLPFPMRNKEYALEVVLDLYDEFKDTKKKLRLVGIRFSNLERDLKNKQINLLDFV